MKVEVDALSFRSLTVLMASVDVKQHLKKHHRAQELCESRGGRPELPSSIVLMASVDGRSSVDVKQHLTKKHHRTQELCESRGGRQELPVLNSPYGLYGRRERESNV